ncbi:S8 family serine peptidase [Streptomyces sp. 7N604]|uniref:S8 family serine peptidase n=1 Tax=Streptomyces sp. 7N604 TaxID=3457415 RepID=UPI003FCFC35C
MRTRSRVLAAGLGVAFMVGGMPPAVADPGPTPSPVKLAESPRFDAASKAKSRTLTLVTGDVLSVSVQPDGRTAISQVSGGGNGHISWTDVEQQSYFLPKQAAPYVSAGLVDRELFNITRLIKDGYDDGKRTTLPLILSRRKQSARDQADRPALDGSVTARELRSIDATAVRENKKKASDFWRDLTGLTFGAIPDSTTSATAPKLANGVTKVWLDRKVKTSLDVSVPQIGAPEAWKSGYTGKGVTIAVLDTGIAQHPDLEGKITAAQDFTGSDTGTDDRTGHGTHVASTIAGTGAASGGTYKGVAPDAGLINAKVLGDDGSGSESQVIAGMEWAASKAQVVSMSLGSDQASDGTDPSSQAINNLTKSTGALFVVAAGNAGPNARTIGSPAAADAALTVGAVSKQDELADFSGRGPRLGDNAIKPEITAPGVGIAAARVKGSPVGDNEPVDDNYARATGTSMATPHVSGTAALLLQQHTEWKADRLKTALTSTAKGLPDLTPFQQGSGRVDVARASAQTVSASTGTLNLGYFESPFDEIDPVTKTVTYRNDGDQPVSLDLRAAATSEKGSPAGGDLLKVEPAGLTVPAGGTADAVVTLDVTKGDLGLYGGALTATSDNGSTVLHTALAFTKQQVHRVSLRAKDREGRPASARVALASQATGDDVSVDVDGATGEGTAKVYDDGPFSVTAFVYTKDEHNRHEIEQTAFAFPDFKVPGDRELVLDARQAKPVDITIPESVTEVYELQQHVYRKAGKVNALVSSVPGVAATKLSAAPSEAAVTGEFEYVTREHLIAPRFRRVSTVNSGVELHPTYMGFRGFTNPPLDGKHRLEVIDVGAGAPEDYRGKDVKGKIALIVSNPEPGSSMRLIATAAANGAKATLIYGNEPGMFRDPSVFRSPIPPMQIDYEEGHKLLDLLKAGPVHLGIDAVAGSPYDYSIVLPEADRIPNSLTYRLGADKLATVDTRLHAVYPGQVGAYTAYGRRPYEFLWSALPLTVPYPHRHQLYVVADRETHFGQSVWARFPELSTVVFSHTYEPGDHRTEEWFKAPLGPGVTDIHAPSARRGNTLLINIGEITDSDPEHGMNFSVPSAEVRVYEDGELVGTGEHPSGTLELDNPDPATYRIELDVKEQLPDWRFARTSNTSWTFGSEKTPDDTWTALQLIKNFWDLALDGDNATRADRPFVLKFKPETQMDAPPVPIKDVRLEVSYDKGKTWQPTHKPVELPDGSYRTLIQHPKLSDTDGKVALRLHVADEQGGKLDQTVYDAYALK